MLFFDSNKNEKESIKEALLEANEELKNDKDGMLEIQSNTEKNREDEL